jgi:multiple sugar transport system permease protein/sn-glycerol 3-phosphate transport system permease protein
MVHDWYAGRVRGSRTRSVSRRRAGRKGRDTLWAYALLSPSLIGVAAFLLIPIVAVFAISFYHWSLLGVPSFAGLGNYQEMIKDPQVLGSLLSSIYYVVLDIPLQTSLAMIVALLLNRSIKGTGAFRALFVLPWLATPVVMGIIWQWLLDPAHGALNGALHAVGITGPAWLSDAHWAMPTIVAVNLWQYTGYISLFYLAGLQNIPPVYYEASQLDGANSWKTFWTITVPLLHPTTYFVLITEVIGSFQVFDTIYVMTSGGPGDATRVLNYSIFTTAFQDFQMGYASAISVLLFFVLLLSAVFITLFFRRRTTYDMS